MATSPKIRTLDELAATLECLRAEGRRVVHCHGVFDLLHVGHVRHFEQARKLGDLLVVTLTPDRFVNKGVGRPAFTESLPQFSRLLQVRRPKQVLPPASTNSAPRSAP